MIKINNEEFNILISLPYEYFNGWIARNYDGNLYAYSEKEEPYQSINHEWYWRSNYDEYSLKNYNNMFKDITWNCRKYFKIKDLLIKYESCYYDSLDSEDIDYVIKLIENYETRKALIILEAIKNYYNYNKEDINNEM